MTDTVDRATRSRIMSRIRSVSMKEKRAKALCSRRAGCRLVHQPKGIPGKPDFANKTRKVAVYFHGCFFHQPCPRNCSSTPKSNVKFWKAKFRRNRERHREVSRELRKKGWRVIEVWEHSL